ncbi:MAG: hypothetical protein MUC64_14815, partial [Rubritepida sp.]|nr:hypothetical protein [Rubritepida sp.]
MVGEAWKGQRHLQSGSAPAQALRARAAWLPCVVVASRQPAQALRARAAWLPCVVVASRQSAQALRARAAWLPATAARL